MSCYSYRFAHTMMGIKNVDNTMIQISVFCVIRISENEVFKDIPKKERANDHHEDGPDNNRHTDAKPVIIVEMNTWHIHTHDTSGYKMNLILS